MDAGIPPRFVPTLTEVVHDAADDAPVQVATPPADPAGPAGVAAASPELEAWQIELTAILGDTLSCALQSWPPPASCGPQQVQQALQAAWAQACDVAFTRH